MSATVFATTDIADDYGDAVYVLAPKFHSFGGVAYPSILSEPP